MARPRIAVIAVGGNALTREGEAGTYAQQWRNATKVAGAICRLVEAGYRAVLIHGNGPQVGNLSIQQEEGSRLVPAQPLAELVAMTQGAIGHLLSLALHHASTGTLGVVDIVTHVEVQASDPAFRHPTKPIGPFLAEDVARRLAADRDWVVREDAGRGFRRVVASPEPKDILEATAIRELANTGFLVIAGGGGGIPVVRRGRRVAGVDAVIDKDLTAARLATSVGADTLVFLTGASNVFLDWGTPGQQAITEMTTAEAEEYIAAGQFAAGSMGPKMTAAVRFLAQGGQQCIITSSRHLAAALAGTHGTRIVPPHSARPLEGGLEGRMPASGRTASGQ
jgi:carbamate kinase